MGEQAANTKQPAALKERIHGNAQSFFYTLLRVLPPTELSRFRPQSSKIYSHRPYWHSSTVTLEIQWRSSSPIPASKTGIWREMLPLVSLMCDMGDPLCFEQFQIA